jgi:hypothetical protein
MKRQLKGSCRVCANPCRVVDNFCSVECKQKDAVEKGQEEYLFRLNVPACPEIIYPSLSCDGHANRKVFFKCFAERLYSIACSINSYIPISFKNGDAFISSNLP